MNGKKIVVRKYNNVSALLVLPTSVGVTPHLQSWDFSDVTTLSLEMWTTAHYPGHSDHGIVQQVARIPGPVPNPAMSYPVGMVIEKDGHFPVPEDEQYFGYHSLVGLHTDDSTVGIVRCSYFLSAVTDRSPTPEEIVVVPFFTSEKVPAVGYTGDYTAPDFTLVTADTFGHILSLVSGSDAEELGAIEVFVATAMRCVRQFERSY